MRQLLAIFLPGGALLLGAWAVQHEPVVRATAAPYAGYFCVAAVIVPVLLSWYHDQSRFLAISGALALAVLGWNRLPAEAHAARLAVVFLLPVIFLICGAFPEQRVFTRMGAVRVGVLACAVIAVVSITAAKGGWWSPLLAWGEGRSTWTPLSWTAQLAFAAAALVVLFFAIRRGRRGEVAMLWSLLAAFLGAQAVAPDGLYFYFGAAALVAMFAVLEQSVEITDRDELTGLPGRRALNRALEHLGRQYALGMCDVDHFKRFNDTYGHATGDQVLRMVASRLSRVSGDSQVFRYGGEEFVIVFRGRSAEEAVPLADAVRKSIADAGFAIRGPNRPVEKPTEGPLPAVEKKLTVTITISIGVAETSAKDSTPEAVLRAADQALYQAKEAGRNRVCVAEAPRATSASAP
jgi:diguanylate cyclase (GGDEF)-like protein